MKQENKLKLAVIAGALNALSYKERNPRSSETEVVNNIIKNMRDIIGKLGEDE